MIPLGLHMPHWHASCVCLRFAFVAMKTVQHNRDSTPAPPVGTEGLNTAHCHALSQTHPTHDVACNNT